MNEMPSSVPDWLTVRHGDASVIVVAPHGGNRERPIRRGDGMNDLHTAELGMELAERLDASALINHARDRNDVDLNRVRQLVASAPGFLRLLREAVERVHARGATPLVLFVHGWNMAVPWCDVGVGLRERAGTLFGRYPTVTRPTYRRLVEPLVERLFDAGLGASIGLRYPAAGRDNATQLFSGRHADHEHADVAALSRLAARGAVDAIQLELGIPLRWPGWRRRRFVEILSDTVAAERDESRSSEPSGRRWNLDPKPPVVEPVRDAGYSVQAVLEDGTGLFMGAEPTGPATMATRLCIALADGSMLLFVGEGPWDGRPAHYAVAGFRWDSAAEEAGAVPSVIRVRLAGPVVHYPTHDAFVDLERGLAGAHLVEAEMALEFVAEREKHGILSGSLSIAETPGEICARAVCEPGGRRTGVHPRVRLHLTSGWPRARSVETTSGDAAGVGSVIDVADGAGGAIAVTEPGDDVLRGTTCVAVPVYRPLPDGRVVKVTFGTARFDGEGVARMGVYERVQLCEAGED